MALKEARNKAGLTQGELAQASGVNVRMIQHYEQETKDLNGAKITTLLALCDALSCSLEEIITDADALELIHKLGY